MKNPATSLSDAKSNGRRLACLTAYDYPTARLLDDCGLDLILVGDSLGMVVLGYPDTTTVTMADMLHHTRAVARGAQKTFLASDLPAGSCTTPSLALENARLLRDAGADAVKIEGGLECLPMVEAILADGIPVIGHLGMLPQRVIEEGGYHIKGKSSAESERLLRDAHVLEQAGVSAIVLELVHPPLASALTKDLKCPTIGIGSGPDCDGQILVLHDVIGLFPWFRPKFAEPRADIASEIQRAARAFTAATKA
ncbi:MAG: 3-methyl-2-oxobutanoate hydroxymethyltransferase [Verrucomicrobia bacterium]|nr:3-methyl-2-oxobutanoate hydroxymethyltransferase [Verrucomicrobiota bacterium]